MTKDRRKQTLLRIAAGVCVETLACIVIVSMASCQQVPFRQRAAHLGLELVKDIPLSGSASRLDYQTIDENTRRLFIAHLGADLVTVVDLDSLRVVRDIPDIPSPHGILAVQQYHEVYVSATGADEVYVIDEASLDVIAKIPAGHYPDGIAFDPGTNRIFVSDEIGKTVAVIDPVKHSLVKRVPLASEVGNTHDDAVSGLIYSGAQSVDELVTIDPVKLEVIARYKLPGCKGPHGFYIDAATHCAFITGEDNASIVVFDLTQQRITWKGTVGAGPDVLSCDEQLHRLYVSTESGVVSVFDVRKDRIRKAAESFFEQHAHTVCVDQKTDRVFFPLQNLNGHPVLRVMKPLPN